MGIIQELKNRGVIQTAALYIAVAWGGIEILTFLIDALFGGRIAALANRYLAILLIAGFPVTMYLAWTRDLGLRARRVVRATALAVLLVLVIIWLVPSGQEVPRPSESSAGDVTALAVLPLENLSDEPGQEFFAAGMTEALIAELSRLGAIRVISRTSVMQYAGTTKTIPEIAAELGVDAIVEGSVLRAGNQVRITAQLIDAATDLHLWADSFEGVVEDVLALQSEAAQSMVDGIGASFRSETVRLQPPRQVFPEAYDAFLEAQLTGLESQRDPQAAIAAIERAISLDPTFAPAYALLSEVYGYLALTTNVRQGDAYLQARQLARKALELDPNHPSSRFAMARALFQFEWDWAGAEAQFSEGIRLDPNDANGLALYGSFRTLIHWDCDGGLQRLESARNRDPFNPAMHFDLGVYHFHCRNYEVSLQHLERTTDLLPEFYWARLIAVWNHMMLGAGGRAEILCDALLEEVGDTFDPRLIGSCAWAYFGASRSDRAFELRAQLDNPPEGIEVDPFIYSWTCLGFADRNCALEQLERALKQRSSDLIFLRTGPIFDTVREEPRFKAVVQKMGFPETPEFGGNLERQPHQE